MRLAWLACKTQRLVPLSFEVCYQHDVLLGLHFIFRSQCTISFSDYFGASSCPQPSHTHLQQSSDGASVHGFKGLSYSQIAAMVLAATPDGEICHGINFLVVSSHFATKLSSPTHLSTLYTAVNEKTSSVQVVSRFMSVGSNSRAVHPVFKALFVVLNGECGVSIKYSLCSLATRRAQC